MVTPIRLAQPTDAPALARVMVDTWLAAHSGQVPEAQWQRRREDWTYAVSEQGWRGLLAEIADGSNTEDCVYVAVTELSGQGEGEVVGVAVGCLSGLDFLPNAAEVSGIYLRPAFQGRGIGRRLVQAVAQHQANLGKETLLIRALVTNTPARQFYEALGGRIVGDYEGEDYGFPEPQVVYGWEEIQSVAGGNR